jgi:hypothetical protein
MNNKQQQSTELQNERDFAAQGRSDANDPSTTKVLQVEDSGSVEMDQELGIQEDQLVDILMNIRW